MKNVIETYGLTCIQHKQGFPLYVVGVCSTLLSSTNFYNSKADAEKYIADTIKSLSNYGIDLQYNDCYDFGTVLTVMLNGKHVFCDMRNHCIYCKG